MLLCNMFIPKAELTLPGPTHNFFVKAKAPLRFNITSIPFIGTIARMRIASGTSFLFVTILKR